MPSSQPSKPYTRGSMKPRNRQTSLKGGLRPSSVLRPLPGYPHGHAPTHSRDSRCPLHLSFSLPRQGPSQALTAGRPGSQWRPTARGRRPGKIVASPLKGAILPLPFLVPKEGGVKVARFCEIKTMRGGAGWLAKPAKISHPPPVVWIFWLALPSAPPPREEQYNLHPAQRCMVNMRAGFRFSEPPTFPQQAGK